MRDRKKLFENPAREIMKCAFNPMTGEAELCEPKPKRRKRQKSRKQPRSKR